MSNDGDDGFDIKNIIPHSPEAERAALGAALSSQDALHQVVDNLSSEDFYDNAHKTIFRSIVDFHRDNVGFSIDPVNFKNFLTSRNVLSECGGMSYIIDLIESSPSSSNIESYIKIIKDNSIRRSIITYCDTMKVKAEDKGFDANLTLDKFTHLLIELSTNTQKNYINIRDIIEREEVKFENRIGKKINLGIKCGLTRLDKMTNGFKPGQLIIVAARPGAGKTSFAISCILNMTRETVSKFVTDEDGREQEEKKTVKPAFFSFEMGAEDILYRMLSSVSKVSAAEIINNTLRRGSSEHEKLNDAFDYLFTKDIFFKYAAGMHLRDLVTQCRKMKRDGMDIAFIDYLSLIDIDDLGNRNSSMSEKVGIVTRNLKLLAMELQIPIVLLVQLNREAEEKMPTMANLRDSGAIEQDADIIIFLHNPDRNKNAELASKGAKSYASDDNDDEQETQADENRQQRIILYLAKQRNGMTGAHDVCFLPNIMTYTNYAEEYT